MIQPTPSQPSWLELTIGLAGMAIFGIGLAFLVIRLPLDRYCCLSRW